MRRIAITALLIVTFFAFFAGSCEDPGADQRKESAKARADTFDRAEKKYPLPHTENFPLRKALVDMTKREDMENHPWYVYVLGDPGNVIGYYVARTAPINACNFLSSTEVITDGSGDETGSGNVIVKAPSIDGVYYGDSECTVWVLFDYSSNAMIKLGDVKFFTADKPLNLDAEPIKVKRSS